MATFTGSREAGTLVAMARVAVLLMACLWIPAPALAHGGGLDRNGGHHDRQRGGYHCHREPCFSRERAERDEEPPPERDEEEPREDPER